MCDETRFDEIKLTEQLGKLCGLYKLSGEIDPEVDYTYSLFVNAEIMEPSLNTVSNVIKELCEKHDIDGSIEGLFFEPGIGVVYDVLEINFDHEEQQAAVEFAEEFFNLIRK